MLEKANKCGGEARTPPILKWHHTVNKE